MLAIDLSGCRAFVAGVADDQGYGWGIAKALHRAGAKISLGVWPPAFNIFKRSLESGRLRESQKYEGGELTFEAVFPLDVAFDTMDEVPAEIRDNKRYQGIGDFTVAGCARAVIDRFGDQEFMILVHSVANAPEVAKPLHETTRHGYLAAMGTSAYSLISLVRHFDNSLLTHAAVISLSYLAADRVVANYGGGMDGAKAALQSHTRMLAKELCELRFFCISAPPLKSRAAQAIGDIDPVLEHYAQYSLGLDRDRSAADDVGQLAAFLASPMGDCLNGSVVYADHGFHTVGLTINRPGF